MNLAVDSRPSFVFNVSETSGLLFCICEFPSSAHRTETSPVYLAREVRNIPGDIKLRNRLMMVCAFSKAESGRYCRAVLLPSWINGSTKLSGLLMANPPNDILGYELKPRYIINNGGSSLPLSRGLSFPCREKSDRSIFEISTLPKEPEYSSEQRQHIPDRVEKLYPSCDGPFFDEI